MTLLGLAVLVVGTFLPWLRSGQARRNSYQAGGTIRRLVDPPAPLDALFALWPLLAVAAAAAIALFVLGMRRSGAIVAWVTAVIGGSAAFGAATSRPSTYASVIISGPTTTLIGAGLVIVTAPIFVVAARPSRRRTA